MNVKKVWPVAATSLIALTSMVSADDNSKMDRNHKEKEVIINPSTRPQMNRNWSFDIEGFAWNAHQDGLQYGVEDEAAFPVIGTVTTSTTGINTIQDGNFLEPHQHWDLGFRAGIGYTFNHDGYDIFFKWTHFKNHSSHGDCDSCAGSGAVFLALDSNLPNIGTSIAGSGSATTSANLEYASSEHHWKMRLDMADLELGREFMTSKWLALRPHIGLRGGWVKQHVEIEYNTMTQVSAFIPNAAANTVTFDEVKFKNNFKGIGVRGGLDTQFGFCGGWSIYGNMALSILYGRFSLETQENFSNSSSASSIQLLDVTDGFHSSKAITDLALGLRYGHTFQDNCNIQVSFGWEHHMFFNQNQMWRLPRVGNEILFNQGHGDLSTQGWTLALRFDF